MPTATRNRLNNNNETNGHEFSEKIAELRSLLTDITKSAPSAASDALDDLKSKALALCDQCEEKTENMAKAAYKTAKEHPAQVAIGAVGVGLLVWWLMSHGAKNQ
jgi:ElaB/YqjD/DUF883 family membrane-anchored ribosome-binding protein